MKHPDMRINLEQVSENKYRFQLLTKKLVALNKLYEDFLALKQPVIE